VLDAQVSRIPATANDGLVRGRPFDVIDDEDLESVAPGAAGFIEMTSNDCAQASLVRAASRQK
jgi:hypothetical protein